MHSRLSKTQLTIATRKSPLAWGQAEMVKQALLAIYPTLIIELIGISTQADKFLNIPLYEIGGKGLFVKELEMALLKKEADIAVHSVKDLPAEFPEELMLGAVCQREDSRDVFISNQYDHLTALPKSARIGTSSLRRQCQMRALRPDLQFCNLRGNIGSRLQKLTAGEFDAIILAAAGLKRLHLEEKIRQYFTIDEMIPAIGQGAIGIECRKEDLDTQKIISALDHLPTRHCITAERAMNAQFGGNCQIPIAAHASLNSDQLEIVGMIGQPQGNIILRDRTTGSVSEAAKLGKDLAAKLIARGAFSLLDME